jgi:hypothetical protein
VVEDESPSPDRNALLDQKGADLIDRRRPARDQMGANTMESLKFELILRLLTYDAQVWPQGASASL